MNFSLHNYPQAKPENGTSRQNNCGCVFPFMLYYRIIDTCMVFPGFEPFFFCLKVDKNELTVTFESALTFG